VSAFVVDASVAISWCIEDEASPTTERLLDQAVENGIVVPALWLLEMANVLRIAEKKKRILAHTVDARLVQISEFIISVEDFDVQLVWTQVLDLARRHDLTSYDACYLVVAKEHALPLASLDKAMIKAAKAEGIRLLD
jgi:predicted nucleic acid-binding protein